VTAFNWFTGVSVAIAGIGLVAFLLWSAGRAARRPKNPEVEAIDDWFTVASASFAIPPERDENRPV